MWSWHVLAPTVSDGAIRPLGPLTSKRQGRGRLTPVQGPFQAAAYAREGHRLRVLEHAPITAWSAASFVGFLIFFACTRTSCKALQRVFLFRAHTRRAPRWVPTN